MECSVVCVLLYYTWSEFFFHHGNIFIFEIPVLTNSKFFFVFWKKYVNTALILHQFQIRKKLSKFKDNFPTNISVEFSDISIGISNQNINSVCLDLERVKCKVAKKGLLGALFFFFSNHPSSSSIASLLEILDAGIAESI